MQRRVATYCHLKGVNCFFNIKSDKNLVMTEIQFEDPI